MVFVQVPGWKGLQRLASSCIILRGGRRHGCQLEHDGRPHITSQFIVLYTGDGIRILGGIALNLATHDVDFVVHVGARRERPHRLHVRHGRPLIRMDVVGLHPHVRRRAGRGVVAAHDVDFPVDEGRARALPALRRVYHIAPQHLAPSAIPRRPRRRSSWRYL